MAVGIPRERFRRWLGFDLAEEGARDAEVVGEADAVVDGDRPRADLDADDALGWLRWPHGLLWRAPPLLRREVRDEN